MKKNSKIIRTLTVFCILTLVFALAVPFLPLDGEARVYEDTLRLHILANSDSERDQAVKLKVRDALLEKMSPMLDGCTSKEEALTVIEANKNIIESIAREVSGTEASVVVGREYYPERDYEGVSLPAGTYTSLRVRLGNAKGHNWWCILYPTLCTGTAKPEKELAEAGFTPSQIQVLTENENPRYHVKFKIVEFLEKVFG